MAVDLIFRYTGAMADGARRGSWEGYLGLGFKVRYGYPRGAPHQLRSIRR